MIILRKLFQKTSFLCFLSFVGYLSFLAVQQTFVFAIDEIALSALLLILLNLATYARMPDIYTTKFKKIFIFKWIAIKIFFIVDAVFTSPSSLFLYQDTKNLSLVEYLQHLSYPYPLQTFGMWIRNHTFGLNVFKNLRLFVLGEGKDKVN